LNKFLSTSSIIISRTIYGLNWYTISPLYLLIAKELSINYGELGLIAFSFLLGAMIFQIPAGILAAKIGNKNTAVLGMLILSLASIFSGMSWDFISLLIFRFILGIGAALFFSPAVHTLRLIFEKKRQGFIIGLYNAAFSIGAGMALLTWSFVASFTNWRIALIIGGILGLILTFENHVTIPNYRNNNRVSFSTALKNKTIIYLGIATSGFWGLNYALTQFIDSYLIAYKGMNENIAGMASSITLFGAIIGNIAIGEATDRIGKRKQVLLLSLILIAIVTFLTPFIDEITLWLYVSAQGFLSGAIFALIYAITMDEINIDETLKPLAASMINAFNIGIGSLASPLYTYITSFISPEMGWFSIAIYELALLSLYRKLL
jgi:MFS family permease